MGMMGAGDNSCKEKGNILHFSSLDLICKQQETTWSCLGENQSKQQAKQDEGSPAHPVRASRAASENRHQSQFFRLVVRLPDEEITWGNIL